MTAEALASGITTLYTVFENAITMIASTPLTLAMAIVPLVGAGIGIFKRLA